MALKEEDKKIGMAIRLLYAKVAARLFPVNLTSAGTATPFTLRLRLHSKVARAAAPLCQPSCVCHSNAARFYRSLPGYMRSC